MGILSIVLGYFVKKFVKRPFDSLDHSSLEAGTEQLERMIFFIRNDGGFWWNEKNSQTPKWKGVTM